MPVRLNDWYYVGDVLSGVEKSRWLARLWHVYYFQSNIKDSKGVHQLLSIIKGIATLRAAMPCLQTHS